MRFLDLAADLAAVVSASRSVASKHAALRTRQLGAAYPTAAVDRAAAVETPSVPAAEKAESAAEGDANISSTPAPAPAPAPEPTPEPTPAATSTPLSEKQPPTPLPEDIKSATPPPDEEPEVPTFIHRPRPRATRLPSVLEELRRKKAAEAAAASRSGSGGGAPLPHPLDPRYNKVLQVRAREMADALAAAEAASAAHSAAAATHVESSGTSTPAPPAPTAPTTPPAPPAPTEPESSSPQAETKTPAAPPPTPAKRRVELKESKVPATRLSRMWNYGGLAAGMLGGALTESISRGFGGSGTTSGSVMLSAGNLERLVSKLSRMRGAALKLGQMMSFQDAKMLPAPLQEVLQRVQDGADYMPAWQRDRVLATNLGADWRDLFSAFEEKPLAAASIGQVHRATLRASGAAVAVKIQFPGVADSINSDLDNLGILLTATRMLPRGLYLDKSIDNARTELAWECDYEREAACAQRFSRLLEEAGETGSDAAYVVPTVYPEASGKQVLTMAFMDGVGVTKAAPDLTQAQRDWIGTQILRLCLLEITQFHFMQTDPNWTNFLYNAATSQLELLDFGASREYPVAFIDQYVRLLRAAAALDLDGVHRLSRDLGYLTGHESKAMLDAHTQSVLTLAEPFRADAPAVYDFQDQTITDRVRSFIPVMVRERLTPPPEETYSLHRKLSGAFLLCARLGSKVECRRLFTESIEKMKL